MIVKKIFYERYGRGNQLTRFVYGWYLFGIIPLYVVKESGM